MSKVIACYKWVMDESTVQIKGDLTIDTSSAQYKISNDDRNCIEAAVRAAKSVGGQAVGLTFGGDKAQKSLKDALSRGLNEVTWAHFDQAETADGKGTAKALAAAIGTMDDVALVLCSDGASDTLARQTAPRIAAALDWPVVTAVRSIRLSGDEAVVEKKLEDRIETITVKLPAVISVLAEINPAPLPSLMQIMAAGKKPVHEFKADQLAVDFATNVEVTERKGYAMDRKNILFKDGEAEDIIKELTAALRKEGVL